MTYQQLKQSCTTPPTGRFDSATQDTEVGRWVNNRHAKWWNAAPWPWRVAPDNTLAVVAGTRAYVVPVDYGETWGLFDQYGAALTYLSPVDFLALYSGVVPTGQPIHYALMGGSLYLGPTSSVTASFKWQYMKRVQHFQDTTLVVTTGAMSDPGDIPIMGFSPTHDDYHYALVAGAQSLGLQLSNAPASQWQPLEAMWNDMLTEAVSKIGRAEQGEVFGMGTRVWGDEYALGHAWR